MNGVNFPYAILAILAGMGIPVMARLNANLAHATSSNGWSALLLFSVAFGGVAIFLVATRQPLPSGWQAAAPLTYFSGILVAFYLLSITFLIPRFGVVPSILAVVTGQIVAAAAIDHFGLLGSAHRPIDAIRACGIIVMLAGLAIVVRPPSA